MKKPSVMVDLVGKFDPHRWRQKDSYTLDLEGGTDKK